MRNKMNAKKLAVFIISAVIGSVVSSIAVQRYFRGAPASVDSSVAAISAELNKSLPAVVDRETRWDTTAPAPGKMLIYRYTLVNLDSTAVDGPKLADALRPTIVANYRTNPQMESFRKMGLTLVYQYSDKSGVFVTEITVRPKDLEEEQPNQ